MEKSSQTSDTFTNPLGSTPCRSRRASLSLVNSPLRLAQPPEPAPDDWQQGLDGLLTWLGIDVEITVESRPRGLKQVAGWAIPAAASQGEPVFAPWLSWSPAAFQHGGVPGLPRAQWVASYLLDHGVGLASRQREIDCMLMSPHPATCIEDEAGTAPLPRTGVMKAMILAAKAEGRGKLAIIVHARQRNAIARQLLLADRTLTRDGITLEILAIEDALGPLMSGAAPWDAMIVMPDLRSIVFAMLAESTGVRGAWPMLWHGAHLSLITSEAAGEGLTRGPLDAVALIHALALSLNHAGFGHAAWRLHEAWARLRDSGVTTPVRGSAAPYVTSLSDPAFIYHLCNGMAVSKRSVPAWLALGGKPSEQFRSESLALRVVASSPSGPSC